VTPFIHLNLHSAYSLLEGALRIKQIPKLCVNNHMPAVAITDTHNLFGALEFATACADQGIQPIIGATLHVSAYGVEDAHKAKQSPDKLIILCQSEAGYLNLVTLLSESYLNMDPAYSPQITLEVFLEKAEGLIVLNGGKESSLFRLYQTHQHDLAQELTGVLKNTFQDRLYIEIQRHGTLDEGDVEEKLISLAHEHSIPLVATNAVFFENRDIYKAHDALLCVAEGRYVSEDDRRKVTAEHYFKSTEEMAELFKDLPEALQNTVTIAKRCHFMPTPRKPILPRYDCGDGRTEQDELRLQANAGLRARLSHLEAVPEEYQQRLDFEINVIETMGFSGYFLIVADFIQYAKSKGIPVGPGRGSGAGSLVAWSLTITDMDPLRFNLIFERFLNPERVSMPDFDIDFCQDRRDEVIEYVGKKYGHDRVAHIITFGKLQARAVIRDVGRVLQMPYGQVDKISKLIPNNPANPVTLEQALTLEPALEEARATDETVAELIDMGIKLEGLYRHASKHAAGVVIADRPLTELVPLYLDEPGSVPATQFNMKYVEMAGLVKFDFLGLKTLTVIEKCCELIGRKGIQVDISKIPLDDVKTFELLQRVETIGIFQLESGGMKEVVRKLRPDRFDDLIALVALFRPGPMDDIPRYLACKHGEEEVTYLHPALEPILKDSYGVMVYQEQVMQIAQSLGGYTLGAADLLRRAMGKKIKSEMDDQRERFTKGAVENGVKPEIASQIFDQMAKFAGYGFNKSHSAPYALLAYQTAYLKANYPQEFFAASMTLDMHNTDKLNAFRQDMIRAKVPLLPPDINQSFADFQVEGDGVRYALAALKNVGMAAMEELVQEREEKGQFKDTFDFMNRFNPSAINKRQLEHMIAAGVMDTLEGDRALLYSNVDVMLRHGAERKNALSSGQRSLFGGGASNAVAAPTFETPNPWGPLERLQHEFSALSFYLSSHPLEIYKNLEKLHATPSHTLEHVEDGQNIRLMGVIITKTERTSKTGNRYAFAQISDQTGVFEVALFSKAFEQARDLLIPGKALLIQATIKHEGESYRILANNLTPLEEAIQSNKGTRHRLRITVDAGKSVKKVNDLISTITPGSTELILCLNIPQKPSPRITLPQGYAITPEVRSRLLSLSNVLLIEDV